MESPLAPPDPKPRQRVERSAQTILGTRAGTLRVFRWFRPSIEAIQALTAAVEALNQTQRELGPALDRLEKLERFRHQFEAECEGMLLKADGKLKAASSAEQRERQLKKANQRNADPFDFEGAEDPEAGGVVQPFDVEASEAQRLSAMRLDLAPNNKARAVRAKFGL